MSTDTYPSATPVTAAELRYAADLIRGYLWSDPDPFSVRDDLEAMMFDLEASLAVMPLPAGR